MKIKIILMTVYTLFLLLAGIGCEKDKEKKWTDLPPETQEGKNTIGCLIDGKVWGTNFWTDGITFMGRPSIGADYNIVDDNLTLLGLGAQKKDKSKIGFLVRNPKQNKFAEISEGRVILIENYKEKKYKIIKKDSNVEITLLDEENKIVSGCFSFTAINEDDNEDIINVTRGRFDIKINAGKYNN